MEPKVGQVSGVLEERELNIPRGSKRWAGRDYGWQTQESFEKALSMRNGGAFFDFTRQFIGDPVQQTLGRMQQALTQTGVYQNILKPVIEPVTQIAAENIPPIIQSSAIGQTLEDAEIVTEAAREELRQRGQDPRFADTGRMLVEEATGGVLGKTVGMAGKVLSNLPPPSGGMALATATAGAAPMPSPVSAVDTIGQPLLSVSKGQARLKPRRGGRGDFMSQEEFDTQADARVSAVRDKRDEVKEVIQNIEENNPGVKKGVLAATNKEYKRAKENLEDLEALVSSEESNIVAPEPGKEWAYPPSQPRAKEVKAVENDLRGTMEAFELHHLVPKGISAAMMNRVRDFIEDGVATVDDLKRFAMRPTELGLPNIGDLEDNIKAMMRIPHNRFHTEMRYQGSYQFPGQKLEISKQNLATELRKIKNFKDLERLWDEMLQGDIKYLVETAGTWEKMDEALKSVSPEYTGTALYKPPGKK